jgi:hypothetical protein
MTHDYTYLRQLPVQDLLDRAREAGPENHLIRALADRLEKYADVYATIDALADQLNDAERRADGWREEAQAVQRQLDQVRG